MAALHQSAEPELKETSETELLSVPDTAATELAQATESNQCEDDLKRSQSSVEDLDDEADGLDETAQGKLPPRKRAKTKDEKEQRRIERIMRNRQAAHASREKKRRHMETLETQCRELTTANKTLEERVRTLQQSQVHTLDQQTALQIRVEQLEAAIRLAKSSGDLAALDSMAVAAAVTSTASAPASVRTANFYRASAPSSPPELSPELSTDLSAEVGSPVPSLVDDCGSPTSDQFYLQSSHNSPGELYDDAKLGGDTTSPLVLPTSGPTGDSVGSGTNSSKTHHPAVMVR